MSQDSFELLIRRAANVCGIDITRYRPQTTEAGRLTAMLSHHGIDVVLDVGANVGQFASGLRRAGYSGRLVSFEPLSEAYEKLLVAADGDANWDVAPRTAIGDHQGEIEIHVSHNSVSSSILNMLESHSNSAPSSRYIGNESVKINTLDTLAISHLESGSASFLKIDTQGYEDRVLNGARNTLKRLRGVQLELSLVPLYEGQQLFDTFADRLQALGFVVWAIWPGFCDPVTGRMLQVDAVFFRE